jgi:hypothetical protein
MGTSCSALCLALVGAAGCIGANGNGPEPSTGYQLASELEPATWHEMKPGGRTACARGTPYSFWVWPGKSNRVVIDFAGGGACWDEATCRMGSFTQSVEPMRRAIEGGFDEGIYDKNEPDNPFGRDWHVVVPYCTGDVHWGDAAVTYGKDENAFTIQHRGAANARAVLEWVYFALPSPDRIFVTGCSAGSYGSALWSGHVMRHYQRVPTTQLGDAGTGIVTDAWFQKSFPSWRAEGAFPMSIPELDPTQNDLMSKDLTDLYVALARRFPQNRFAQYSSVQDEEQIGYFARMGGQTPDAWRRRMLASIDEIDDSTDNFASFIAPGDGHCITTSEDFYDLEVDGVRFVEWIRQMQNAPAPSVRCTDEECH